MKRWCWNCEKDTKHITKHAIGNSRARSGNFGIKQEYSYEYKIFVHKNDYD